MRFHLRNTALLIALAFVFVTAACGDSDDDNDNQNANQNTTENANQNTTENANQNNGNNSSIDISEESFVATCVEYSVACFGEEPDPQEGCEQSWVQLSQESANPAQCVDDTVVHWECVIAEECDEDSNETCFSQASDASNSCTG